MEGNVFQGEEQGRKQNKDGINIDIKGLEDLDYVDDLIEDKLSEYEIDECEVIETNVRNQAFVDKPLSGTTGNNSHVTLVQGRSKNPVMNLSDEELVNMPRVKNLFNKFWEEKMKELNGSKGEKAQNKATGGDFIKSPSDTMIYVPALMKSPPIVKNLDKTLATTLNDSDKIGINEVMVNNIVSDFVDAVRLEQQGREDRIDLQEKERRRASVSSEVLGQEDARLQMDNAVNEAEKFRASVAASNPGMEQHFDSNIGCKTGEQHSWVEHFSQTQQIAMSMPSNIPNIGVGVSDDDFFHLTCHIDPSLIHKIEKGEFVEL